jgi:hypothetical protein
MSESDDFNCTLETKQKVLFLLSIDCLASLWGKLGLSLSARQVAVVHFAAQAATLASFHDVPHLSELPGEEPIVKAFDTFWAAVAGEEPKESIRIARWANAYIEDERQARVDRQFQLAALDAAINPKSIFDSRDDQPFSIDVTLALNNYRQVVLEERLARACEDVLSREDVELLGKERLPLGDTFIHPTLDLAQEIANRVAFLRELSDLQATIPLPRYRSVLSGLRASRNRAGQALAQLDSDDIPNLAVLQI